MKRDHAWGGGVRIGGVLDVDDRLSLGATYASPTWFQRFRHYRELLLGPLNTPQNLTVGAVVHATPDTDIAVDVKYVGWSGVTALKINPANGGFGWNSKPIFMIGAQHRLTKDITLRAGYNYGESPIPTENTFANSLFPAVTEHHLSVGGSYKVTPAWTISGSGFYSPTATQTDDGTGDGKSGAGKGVTVSMYQMGVQIGIARKF